jgi:hypothetical protein
VIEDTGAMMALRGMMRNALVCGADLGTVMFAAVKQAREDHVTDEQLQKVVDDLRAEGRIPHV